MAVSALLAVAACEPVASPSAHRVWEQMFGDIRVTTICTKDLTPPDNPLYLAPGHAPADPSRPDEAYLLFPNGIDGNLARLEITRFGIHVSEPPQAVRFYFTSMDLGSCQHVFQDMSRDTLAVSIAPRTYLRPENNPAIPVILDRIHERLALCASDEAYSDKIDCGSAAPDLSHYPPNFSAQTATSGHAAIFRLQHGADTEVITIMQEQVFHQAG